MLNAQIFVFIDKYAIICQTAIFEKSDFLECIVKCFLNFRPHAHWMFVQLLLGSSGVFFPASKLHCMLDKEDWEDCVEQCPKLVISSRDKVIQIKFLH